MPFREKSRMSQKLEFVTLAQAQGANVSALCVRFGIGRTCGYKLLKRFAAQGLAGLEEVSRRPKHSPRRTRAATEAAVLGLREKHPAWGGRKIAKRLKVTGADVLAPSTVTNILKRHGVELGRFGGGAQAFTRFEHEAPNDLWQMDFKGHVAMRAGRLHPLTVLDDHSRYSILIGACGDEQTQTVQDQLIAAFRRFGLPTRMAMDNGSPWGDDGDNDFTRLTVWLIETGIGVTHSRPRHPQTLGKDERFHRSLKAEALSGAPFAGLAEAQIALETWRHVYNHERPHEALGLAVPASRYRPSPRNYREVPDTFDYAPTDILRKVQNKGEASLLGRIAKLPKAFKGKIVAFRPTEQADIFEAYFRHQPITTIDLKACRKNN
jgi:transposase InsO family protein